jgi:hypothetical protein
MAIARLATLRNHVFYLIRYHLATVCIERIDALREDPLEEVQVEGNRKVLSRDVAGTRGTDAGGKQPLKSALVGGVSVEPQVAHTKYRVDFGLSRYVVREELVEHEDVGNNAVFVRVQLGRLVLQFLDQLPFSIIGMAHDRVVRRDNV